MSAHGKRRAADTEQDLDATLSALTSKLASTSTRDHDGLVALVCEILGVDAGTAAFYLEASNNDPHAAVHFHVQNTGTALGHALPSQDLRQKRSKPTENLPMPVTIVGLPDGWGARVSEAGTIVFPHLARGPAPATVPPSFGARADDSDGKEAMSDKEEIMSDAVARGDGKEAMSDEVFASAPATAAPAEVSESNGRLREHVHVVCDACERQIAGTRYRCLTRLNYDLCAKCMWDEPHAALRSGNEWMKMAFVTA